MAAFRRELGRRMSCLLSEPFPSRWCSIFPPGTPPVPDGDDSDSSAAVSDEAGSDSAAPVLSPLMAPSDLTTDGHEHMALKLRGRRKRAVDSKFTRRSSRLAGKEPAKYVKMLDRAKAVKAARFDAGKGSPRMRAAVRAAGLDVLDGVPAFTSLRQLQEMGAVCGVDLEALAAGARAEEAAREP